MDLEHLGKQMMSQVKTEMSQVKTKMGSIASQQRCIVDEKTRDQLENSVFGLSDTKEGEIVGMGVFVQKNIAISCAHNLKGADSTKKIYWAQNVVTKQYSKLETKEEWIDRELDLCIFKSHDARSFISLHPAQPKTGLRTILAVYQIGIDECLPAHMTSLALLDATVNSVSENHLVFQSTTFSDTQDFIRKLENTPFTIDTSTCFLKLDVVALYDNTPILETYEAIKQYTNEFNTPHKRLIWGHFT